MVSQLGAQISHPNIAPILDFGDDACVRAEVLFFMVMPLTAVADNHAVVQLDVPVDDAAIVESREPREELMRVDPKKQSIGEVWADSLRG